MSGTFVITNNAISFDMDFILRDGHHRLNAVLAANKSIMAVVSVGIAADNFKFVDIGINRSQADRLGMYSDLGSELSKPRVISIAKALLAVGGDSSNGIDIKKVESTIKSNQAGILFAVDNITTGKKGIGSIPVSAAVAAAYLYVDKQKLKNFCAMLNDGIKSKINGESEAGIYLRDAILSGKLANGFAKYSVGRGKSLQRATFSAVQAAIKEAMSGRNYTKAKFGVRINSETGRAEFDPNIYPPIIDFNHS
jgi:hypothetical protein